MNITYHIRKNKTGNHVWARRHGNGQNHSTGESNGTKRIQGCIRAVISDFTRANSTPERDKAVAAALKAYGKYHLIDGDKSATVLLE